MRFNFVDYLKDAKAGILYTTQKTRKWSCNYDINTINQYAMSVAGDESSTAQLNFDDQSMISLNTGKSHQVSFTCVSKKWIV